MHLPTPSRSFHSRDAVLFEFSDTDSNVDTTTRRPVHDETIRRFLSERFAADLKTDPTRTDLDRLLALAREREQFCRGANDFFGLARCLGNQALIQKAHGSTEDALALLRQLEPLCRRIDDTEGLAFALVHQAALLDSALNQPAAALPLAEQALRLATENHLTQLANHAGPLLAHIRARLQAA